ncbi:sigma-54-dependent transcriptional regulator [Sphingoaurantiacus capsulatus]|uniref:Sigma-54-dependent transcriptional regulator n=1 Tax=Sphingoaurantiacus capsulatus TaxID=1771310 RepID=A0ABV7X8T3_9SPHN
MADGIALIVDDDPDILLAGRMLLRSTFAQIVTAGDPAAVPALVQEHRPDVILLDMNFSRGATSGEEGFRLLGEIVAIDPEAVIIVITAHGGINIAVEAMKRGATDFVSKPWANERMLATVKTAAALRSTRRTADVERQRATVVATPVAGGETPLLGSSAAMQRVMSLIERAAPTDANVLILGENGTGKELVARELHRRSRRADKVMVSVDLGAVAESLFDSELFGHLKGSFTDAKADRIGRLQAADGGTLFLDEIGNLPLHLQPKLLTAMEQRKVTPVGSNKPVSVDIRVVSATNLSPGQLGDESIFRQDLLFRLNTVEIVLPPLRERREDIPVLLDHYLTLYGRKYAKELKPVPADVMAQLRDYDWPGNVRALRHAAERAVILSAGDSFAIEDFPLPSAQRAARVELASTEDLNLDRLERQTVERALKKHGWNISLAATELGLTRASLYRRMEKFGL